MLKGPQGEKRPGRSLKQQALVEYDPSRPRRSSITNWRELEPMRRGIMSKLFSEAKIAGALTDRVLTGGAVAVLLSTVLVAPVAAQQSGTPPDFSSNQTRWVTPNGGEFIAVPGSPAP